MFSFSRAAGFCGLGTVAFTMQVANAREMRPAESPESVTSIEASTPAGGSVELLVSPETRGRHPPVMPPCSSEELFQSDGLNTRTIGNISRIHDTRPEVGPSLLALLSSDNFRTAGADRQEALTELISKALQKEQLQKDGYITFIGYLKNLLDARPELLFEPGNNTPSISDSLSRFLDKPVMFPPTNNRL